MEISRLDDLVAELDYMLADMDHYFELQLSPDTISGFDNHADSIVSWVTEWKEHQEQLQRIREALSKIYTATVKLAEDTSIIDLGNSRWGAETDIDAALKQISSESGAELPLPHAILSVTAGMIANHMLTTTVAIKERIVECDKDYHFTFFNELENKTAQKNIRFTSRIVKPGNRVKERSLVREFYSKNKIKKGDELIIVQTGPKDLAVKLLRTREAVSFAFNEKMKNILGPDSNASD